VQFALILLFLFSTGCRPIELVDAKKKRREDPGSKDDDLNDDDLLAINKSNNGFGAEDNQDFSSRDDDALEGVAATSGVKEGMRYYDAIYYEDVRLLVVRSPGGGERDVLAIEVTMAHYKGHKRRPKP
jgi:hypothetical protein